MTFPRRKTNFVFDDDYTRVPRQRYEYSTGANIIGTFLAIACFVTIFVFWGYVILNQ